MSPPPHLASALALKGAPGSRYRVATPALVLDVDALGRNIARMAQRARSAGLDLRPHAKSHKSAFVARRQIKAGAVGVCCAKLGEAEALAETGIGSILITSPIVEASVTERAVALSRKISLALVVDHPDGVDEIGRAVAAAGAAPLDVLIDVDVGLHRTGVADLQSAVSLGQRIAQSAHLSLKGVQGYGGHWQHMKGAQARHAAVAEGMSVLSSAVKALRSNGLPVEIITGGGTGSFAADAALKILTEVQPGSYVFMDRQYRDVLGADPDGDFEQSLFVQATVISVNAEGFVTVDAGLKAFATDAGVPLPVTPPFEDQSYAFRGDEHGSVTRPNSERIALGTRIEFVPPHGDPNVDRFDVFHLVSGDRLVDIVPIEARGRSQ